MCRLFGIIKTKKINEVEKLILLKNVFNAYTFNNRDGFSFLSDKKGFRTLDFKKFLKVVDREITKSKKVVIHLRFSTNITNKKATHLATIEYNNLKITIAHNGVFWTYERLKKVLKKLKKEAKKKKRLKKLIEIINKIEEKATIENDTYLFLAIVLLELDAKNIEEITTRKLKETIEKIYEKYNLNYGVIYLQFNEENKEKVFLISINKEMFILEGRNFLYFNSNNDINREIKEKEIILKRKIKKTNKENLFNVFNFNKEIEKREILKINKDLLNSINIKEHNLKSYNNIILEINPKTAEIKEVEDLNLIKEEINIIDYSYLEEEGLKEEKTEVDDYIPLKYRIGEIEETFFN